MGCGSSYGYKEVSCGGIEYLEQVHALQLCPGCAGSTRVSASQRPGSPSYFQTLRPTHMAGLSFRVFWPPAQTFFF